MSRTTAMWVGLGFCCSLVFSVSVVVGGCTQGCKKVGGFVTGTSKCFEFIEENAMENIYADGGVGGTYEKETPSRRSNAYVNCTCATPDGSDCTAQQTPQENDTSSCTTTEAKYWAADCNPK